MEEELSALTRVGTDMATMPKTISTASSAATIETKRFLPGIKRALRFGVRFTTKGRVALGGVLIKYKYMGVTR